MIFTSIFKVIFTVILEVILEVILAVNISVEDLMLAPREVTQGKVAQGKVAQGKVTAQTSETMIVNGIAEAIVMKRSMATTHPEVDDLRAGTAGCNMQSPSAISECLRSIHRSEALADRRCCIDLVLLSQGSTDFTRPDRCTGFRTGFRTGIRTAFRTAFRRATPEDTLDGLR